ncbi:MAG: hypothetical protein IJW88_04670, partial [Alistipes sp.]|nr:hypothetical protein [Alistipes sp.]
ASTTHAYYLDFGTGSTYLYPQNQVSKFLGASVRCIVKPDTMQNLNCNTINTGTTVTLKDTRDEQDYTVYRFPNAGTAGTNYPTSMAGYCLMTKDLSLGYVTGGSTTAGGNLSLTTDTSAAAGTITARPNGSGWSSTNSDDNLQYMNGPQSGQETYSSHSYYSYGAAQKVCPKGWRLPTKAEYDNIATFMGGNNSTDSSEIRSAPYNFVYGGFFYSGGWYKVGSYGRYWSSTQYDSSYGYNLRFNSSSLYTDSNDKYVGESVRCIMEPPTMQNTACSSLPEGQTSTLPDARDNQDYTIYRFPTTGTAGTNYPTGMAGYCLMTKDLSLGYVTGGSITKGANLTLTTDSSASSGTITARTGTSDWSTTNSDGNLQYINGPQSGQEAYSSHSYYSYGAAQKVCPKGWRLPTKAEYDNIRTFMGGDNSTGSSTIRTNPYNFVYGGFFYSGGWYVVGSEGVYWSSTQYENNNQNGYNLYLAPSRLYTDGVDNMNRGKSVRCVTN